MKQVAQYAGPIINIKNLWLLVWEQLRRDERNSQYVNQRVPDRNPLIFLTVVHTKRSQPQNTNATDSDGSPPAGTADGDSDESPDDKDDSAEELPLDQVFEILKNSRRRETLRYLHEHGKATLSDVAEHIGAIENDTTVQAISSTQRKRVYVGLYQCHLPKMDDANVVNFNKDRGTIELGPTASQLDPYLEHSDERGWHRAYLASIVASGLLFAVVQMTQLAAELATTVILLGLMAGVATISLIHAHHAGDLFP
jgi:DNA-binding transcriptional ArsR family regulator